MANTTIALVGAALLCACTAAKVDKPLTGSLAGNDSDTQIEFWHRLNDEPIASNDDAFHGLLLYMDNKDDSPNYAARVRTLKSRKMLASGFNEPADQAASRGTLSASFVQLTHTRGGLMMAIFGRDNPRYATRELQYLGLYPASSPQQVFTGAEFVGVIGRLEDYQRGDPANKPATILPDEETSAKGAPAVAAPPPATPSSTPATGPAPPIVAPRTDPSAG